jgi:hypothetical protein
MVLALGAKSTAASVAVWRSLTALISYYVVGGVARRAATGQTGMAS